MSNAVTAVRDFVRDRPTAVSAVFVLFWAVFLFAGCMSEEVFWPLFNVFFVLVGALPYVFGSNQSSGLWGAIGDFSTGAVLVSLFGFPMVLKNAYVITNSSMWLIFMSNICLLVSVYVAISFV